MGRVLFDHDDLTGITEYFHWNPQDESFTIEMVQDVTAIAEHAKRQYNDTDERARWTGDMANHVGVIPLSILYAPENRHLREDPQAMKDWLNNPDNRIFRTRPGKV